MKAVGYQKSLPIEQADSLLDIDCAKPTATGHDLLVEVKAISVNPVDTKIRQRASADGDDYKILGWDAAGVVSAVGEKVSRFKVGDEVWYAGDVSRAGSNAEYQLVDERIVGYKPNSLSFAEAAALPLTTITAYELLFERLQLTRDSDGDGRAQRLLVVGGAGGVGSILLQLARQLTDATIIATASRTESREWALQHGADIVIDHSKPLDEELAAHGVDPITHAACLTHSGQHYAAIINAMQAQGRFALIDDPSEPLDISLMKRKSISLHWEFMFTRALFNTEDMAEQHRLLCEVADLVDAGRIKSTLAANFGKVNADNLRRAHQQLESQSTIGKIVLEF
ncbi:zinc-binding alcohol dehydrogenase family protein [Idiomarina xiamenensis]|uniref:Zinc-type alcohol dehydrogenase-like protein n=1 Tax=Idiomarina xiamenensis 10-D-4 TaxID=740709 RepID=K2KDE0_9GAMM|nr:zinc-binding alcohol dehydrogenase family protein [Idiomarina xiamenensis]EKE84717.1 NADPH:quinone reductase [Idiomarina xiamenensis 10-D-4]